MGQEDVDVTKPFLGLPPAQVLLKPLTGLYAFPSDPLRATTLELPFSSKGFLSLLSCSDLNEQSKPPVCHLAPVGLAVSVTSG